MGSGGVATLNGVNSAAGVVNGWRKIDDGVMLGSEVLRALLSVSERVELMTSSTLSLGTCDFASLLQRGGSNI